MFKSAVIETVAVYELTVESAIRGSISSVSFSSRNHVFTVMDVIIDACKISGIADPKFLMKINKLYDRHSLTYDINTELLCKLISDTLEFGYDCGISMYVISSSNNDMLKLNISEIC